MYLKTLPLDAIRLICSFGYPEHKEYMREIGSQLTGRLAYNMSILLEDEYEYRNKQGRLGFLMEEVDAAVLKELFKQCTKCCCCSKHLHNRPTRHDTDEVSVGENFNTDDPCHCRCRQIARDIRRAVMIKDFHEPPLKLRSRLNTLFRK